MKIFVVRLNPDPREGLPYSKYPTLKEYKEIHKNSPMNGFDEAVNYLPESGIVKGYLPPRHLSSMRNEERFCLITVSAKTASKNGDKIFGIQACCRYIGETKRVGVEKEIEKLGLKFHYSCPVTHSMLFDEPIANARDLIMEKNRYWGMGPTYEIHRNNTLNKIIKTAIDTNCINKSNKKLKAILNWINNEDNVSTTEDEFESIFERDVEKFFNEENLLPPEGNSNPEQREVISYQFIRDPKVTAFALKKANGICQKCNLPAPFLSRKNQTPFLEVHHIKTLKDGGSDTIENVIALCPNCVTSH